MTKIMTCFVCLKLCDRFNIDDHKEIIEISEIIDDVSGTSAELQIGDKLSIWDLLHGLMLPSGNDAAIVLADFLGQKLLEEKERE